MGFPNKRLSLILALSVAAVAMSGCTRIRTHQGYLVDNLLIDSIQPGVPAPENMNLQENAK